MVLVFAGCSDPVVAWRTVFWKWNEKYPGSKTFFKTSCAEDMRKSNFASCTGKINSGECKENTSAQVQQSKRVNRYQTVRKCMGLPRHGKNNLTCMVA